jgi:hypothetical protein
MPANVCADELHYDVPLVPTMDILGGRAWSAVDVWDAPASRGGALVQQRGPYLTLALKLRT